MTDRGAVGWFKWESIIKNAASGTLPALVPSKKIHITKLIAQKVTQDKLG